jgi:hypothetical protein
MLRIYLARQDQVAFFLNGAAFCLGHLLTAVLDEHPCGGSVKCSAVFHRWSGARLGPSSVHEHGEQERETNMLQ